MFSYYYPLFINTMRIPLLPSTTVLLASLLCLMMSAPFVSVGQTQNLPLGNLHYELPNDHWALGDTFSSNGSTLYIYKREPIKDKAGRSVIPNISVIIETVPDSTDLVMYSVSKRTIMPFKVKKVLTRSDKDAAFTFPHAVGYKGLYTDQGGVSHTIYALHALNQTKGIQVVCDVTTELFATCDQEFLTLLRSIERSTDTAETLTWPVFQFTERNYGIYRSQNKQTAPNPSSPSGTASIIEEAALLSQTDTIPCKIGTEFGVEYILQSKRNHLIHLDIEWIFPTEIFDPTQNKEFKSIKYPIDLPMNFINNANYSLESEHELVKGIWQLNIYQGNTILYTRQYLLK